MCHLYAVFWGAWVWWDVMVHVADAALSLR
jgi:hypothetical protein